MNASVREFIVQQLLDGRSVENDENLLLSGLVDSLGVMRLVRFLEASFELSIPPEDVTITNFMNIDSICAYVAGRRSDSA